MAQVAAKEGDVRGGGKGVGGAGGGKGGVLEFGERGDGAGVGEGVITFEAGE